MSPMHDLFIRGWQRVGNQTRALLQDVPAEEFTHQPAGVVNHPAWTLAHLIHYHPAISSLLQNQPVADPAKAAKADIYDEGSTPQADASLYLPADELLASYLKGHGQILSLIKAAAPDCFDQKPAFDRWAKAFPTVGDNLVYLMLLHESQHIGQIMVWRRASGLPPLR